MFSKVWWCAGHGHHRGFLNVVFGRSRLGAPARWVFDFLTCQKTTHKQKKYRAFLINKLTQG